MAHKRASRPAKPVRDFGQGRKLEKSTRVSFYAEFQRTIRQTLPMQLESIRSYAAQRGWTVVLETQEIGSGSIHRPKREMLMKAARRREIDIILVWRLDPWRRSVAVAVASRVRKRDLHDFRYIQAPLMRAVLLQGDDRCPIILTTHHSIADGMAVVFQGQLCFQSKHGADYPAAKQSEA
jgi:Resolvase, N terminal domain